MSRSPALCSANTGRAACAMRSTLSARKLSSRLARSEHAARRKRSDQFVKVERNLAEPIAKRPEFRHVSGLAPALARLPVRISAAIVIEKRIETTAGHDRSNSLVVDGGEYRVVAAQRMPDRGEPAGRDFGK